MMAKKIIEDITVKTTVRTQYENNPGAREHVLAMVDEGTRECSGWNADFGGYSIKKMKSSRVQSMLCRRCEAGWCDLCEGGNCECPCRAVT